MYVRERAGYDTITDPYAGSFGELGRGDGGDGYEEFYGLNGDGGFGSDPFSDLNLMAYVHVSGLTTTVDVNGLWLKLEPAILLLPEGETILMAIAAGGDCGSAVNSIGLPQRVADFICHYGSKVWTAFQALAAQSLTALAYNNGRDRTTAEGGGHTLVDSSGTEIGVACPEHEPMLDSAGNVVGVREGGTTYLPAGSPCPSAPVVGTVAGKTWTIKKPAIDLMTRRDLAVPKSASPSRWYKSPWLWGGVGVLAVTGTLTAVYLRRRSRA